MCRIESAALDSLIRDPRQHIWPSCYIDRHEWIHCPKFLDRNFTANKNPVFPDAVGVHTIDRSNSFVARQSVIHPDHCFDHRVNRDLSSAEHCFFNLSALS